MECAYRSPMAACCSWSVKSQPADHVLRSHRWGGAGPGAVQWVPAVLDSGHLRPAGPAGWAMKSGDHRPAGRTSRRGIRHGTSFRPPSPGSRSRKETDSTFSTGARPGSQTPPFPCRPCQLTAGARTKSDSFAPLWRCALSENARASRAHHHTVHSTWANCPQHLSKE
jgi:hypothetical protein